MYNYTNLNKDFYYQIEYVDYDIELMGLTIDKLSYSSVIFLISLKLFGMIAALIIVITYVLVARKVYKLELEGRPITFDYKIQRVLRNLPRFFKEKIFSELTYIEMAEKKYRT